MIHIIGISIAVALFLFVCWLLSGRSGPAKNGQQPEGDQIIDPTDPKQIGLFVGMAGCSIPDAAVAKWLLQRFEETNGRKATFKDVAMLVGIFRGLRQG